MGAVEVKVKMLEACELCGSNQERFLKDSIKSGENDDRSRVCLVFTNYIRDDDGKW